MENKYLYEYAVVRVMPRVEREEFVNVGVIVYCSALRFLQARIVLNRARVGCLDSETDLDEVQHYLDAFGQIALGESGSGPIGNLPHASRFRWLTATRSTVIQTSKVHPGFCDNPGDVLQKLFDRYVG